MEEWLFNRVNDPVIFVYCNGLIEKRTKETAIEKLTKDFIKTITISDFDAFVRTFIPGSDSGVVYFDFNRNTSDQNESTRWIFNELNGKLYLIKAKHYCDVLQD